MSRQIVGYHYRQACPWVLEWSRDGVITRSEPANEERPLPAWIAPALLDVQVNGFGGVDFQRLDIVEADLVRATHSLRGAGCTRFLVTLITRPWIEMLALVARLREIRDHSLELKQSVIGWHLEGPFLSDEPGYCGAHNTAAMRDPVPGDMEQLRQAAGNNALLVTLAPERPGSLETIRQARALGIHVSLGHTNASAQRLGEAVEAGAGCFTHLGNACPQNLDRHDNILLRALELPGIRVSLIADGMHLSPPCFRLIHRALNGRGILYTTDAMSAAGMGPGAYSLGSLKVEVGSDGVVRQPGKTNFAGSSLTPVEGVRRAARMLGCPWYEAWDRFSLAPAAWIHHSAGLEPGHRADFCLIQPNRAEGNGTACLTVGMAGEVVAESVQDFSGLQGFELGPGLE